MANIKKAPGEKKDSISLSIKNKVHTRFREISEDILGGNWSHETEKLMEKYIQNYETEQSRIKS